AVIGRYILPKSIFGILEQTPKGAGGEIQLTDALKALIGREPFYGHVFEGARFDCGTKLGLVEANIAFGLQQDDIKDDLKKILKQYGAF
ncbi:MAG: UTP--glucose-1-phosphate uridylyltransferase, partial [Alphaproteobacteria bacterium]|nr:UTP--glucose-1-phosphate uridylyltransferase [Alphaproteobacteria bacterium]